MTHRPIHEIAEDIISDYRTRNKGLFYAAAPYVYAMRYLNTVTDKYGEDDARSILTYALSNLTTWRGETARTVKQEIREILSHKA